MTWGIILYYTIKSLFPRENGVFHGKIIEKLANRIEASRAGRSRAPLVKKAALCEMYASN